MASITLMPLAAVDRIYHEEQMTIWSGEIVGVLSVAGVLRDDLSYDEGIELHDLIKREIRSVIRMALDHPEARTVFTPTRSGR